MKNSVFGELVFDIGWKTKMCIKLFGYSYIVFVKAKAYFEKDGITEEQEAAFADFNNHKEQRFKSIEKTLLNYTKDDGYKRFVPSTILFERDGSHVILFDDDLDKDNGIVVCISPKEGILTQDEYL